MKSKPKSLVPAALALSGAVFFVTYFAARNLGGGSTAPTPAESISSESKPGESKPGESKSDPSNQVQSYDTLGRIVSLPSKYGKRPLEIHHEEIPHFLGRDGTKVGMKEMIMPFHDLAPGVSLEGFKPGDSVRFTFEVRWNKPPRTLVTALTPLEPGVTLKLSEIVEEK
jgi:hypothetical protein